MKKISNIFLVLVIVLLLSGCSLAKDDSYYDLIDTIEGEGANNKVFLPSRIDFQVYDEDDNLLEIGDKYFVDFACPDHTVFDNCYGAQYGVSMDYVGTRYYLDQTTINDEEQAETKKVEIEITFYILKASNLLILSDLVYENMDGESKSVPLLQAKYMSGSGMSGIKETIGLDGSIQIVDFSFYFEEIDKMNLLTIREFDDNDNLINETMVTDSTIIEEYELDRKTEYYFIIETFINENGGTYTVRTYNHVDDNFNYLYKYTDENGILIGKRISFHK